MKDKIILILLSCFLVAWVTSEISEAIDRENKWIYVSTRLEEINKATSEINRVAPEINKITIEKDVVSGEIILSLEGPILEDPILEDPILEEKESIHGKD